MINTLKANLTEILEVVMATEELLTKLANTYLCNRESLVEIGINLHKLNKLIKNLKEEVK